MKSVISILSIFLLVYTILIHFQHVESFFANENFTSRTVDGYGPYGAEGKKVYYPKCEGNYTDGKKVKVDTTGNVSYDNSTGGPEYIIHGKDRIAVQIRPKGDEIPDDNNLAAHGEKCWITTPELQRGENLSDKYEGDDIDLHHAWCDNDNFKYDKDGVKQSCTATKSGCGYWQPIEDTENGDDPCEAITSNDKNQCNYSYVVKKDNPNHLQIKIETESSVTYDDKVKGSKYRCFWDTSDINNKKCKKSKLPCFNHSSYFKEPSKDDGEKDDEESPATEYSPIIDPTPECNTKPIDWLQELAVNHL